jgi:hypothetical protein
MITPTSESKNMKPLSKISDDKNPDLRRERKGESNN